MATSQQTSSIFTPKDVKPAALVSLKVATRCAEDEQVLAVWSYKRDCTFRKLHEDAIVMITTHRLLKMEKGKTREVERKDIVSVTHVRKNMWRWDKLAATLADGNTVLYGIYDANSCEYMEAVLSDVSTVRTYTKLEVKDHINTDTAAPANLCDLTIVTLNTALITVAGVDPNTDKMWPVLKRARRIAGYLLKHHKDADVLCLQECFNQDCATILNNVLKKHWRHVLKPKAKRRMMTSGLMILSKHPYLSADFMHYSNGVGDELFASKGFVAAQIQPPGRLTPPIFVYNTHVQAGIGVAGRIGKKLYIKYGSTEQIRSEQFAMIKKHMVTYPNQFGYFHSESSSAASLYKAPRVFLCGDINTNMNSELEVMGMSLKHNESSRRSSDAQRDPEQKLEIYYQGKHELFTFLTHIPPENFTNVRDIVTGKVDSNVVVPEGHFTGTCASNAYLKHLFAIETGKRPTDYKCPTTDFDKSYNITEPKGKLIDVISPNYIDHENLNETFSVEIQDVVGISDHHLLKARYSLDLDALITYAGGDQHTNIEAIKVQRSMSVLSDLAKEAEKAEKSHTSSPLSPLTEVKTVQQQPKTVHDEFEDSSDESCVTGPNSNSNSGRATPVLVQDGAVKATTTVPVTATGDKPKPRLSMDTTAVANSSSTTPVVLTSNSESTENSE